MGFHMKLVNFDEKFRQSLRPPVILNEHDITTKEGKEALNNILRIRYEGDTLDSIPRCDCGKVTGRANSNVTCDVCNKKPVSSADQPLEPSVWMAPLEGCVGFINPTAWIILEKALTDNGVSMLEWMCSPTFTPPSDLRSRMRRLVALYDERKYTRGINFFIENFDIIFKMLLDHDLLYNNKPAMTAMLVRFVQKFRGALFPRHLPMASRMIFITEDTVTGRYADIGMTPALDAARTISEFSRSKIPFSLKVREARMVKCITLLAEFYLNTVSSTLGRKEGMLRKHDFGSRLHLSARAVITSISDNHIYDECYLPWSLSAMLFQTFLTSKLLHRGYTPNEAKAFVYENCLRYHPLMEELFNELINEGFGDPPTWAEEDFGRRLVGGIPILLNRNPSLQRGSIQTLRVTKIKNDVRDNSISLSVLILAGFNADFDGDALNLIVIPDRRLYQHFKALEPHRNILDLRRPLAIGGNLKQASPVVATISNWQSRERHQ